MSGDISQTCSEQSYQLFQHTLQRLNKPIYCIPGNHDDPSLLQHYFPNTPSDSITTVTQKNTLLIFINTQVKNQQYGKISNNDHKKLISILESSSSKNIVITLHHPPIEINSIWMDNIGLKNKNQFLTTIKDFKNIKLILFGHVHQDIDINLGDVKLLATPSTCYQFKPNQEDMTYDDLNAGYRIVKINMNGKITSDLYRI